MLWGSGLGRSPFLCANRGPARCQPTNGGEAGGGAGGEAASCLRRNSAQGIDWQRRHPAPGGETERSQRLIAGVASGVKDRREQGSVGAGTPGMP
jgi:hypothetical protein